MKDNIILFLKKIKTESNKVLNDNHKVKSQIGKYPTLNAELKQYKLLYDKIVSNVYPIIEKNKYKNKRLVFILIKRKKINKYKIPTMKPSNG